MSHVLMHPEPHNFMICPAWNSEPFGKSFECDMFTMRHRIKNNLCIFRMVLSSSTRLTRLWMVGVVEWAAA